MTLIKQPRSDRNASKGGIVLPDHGFRRRLRFPRLSHALWPGLTLAVWLAVSYEAHAQPNPIEGSLGGGRVGTGAAPEALLSAGGPFMCGIKSDGTLACWGDNFDGQATPPAGAFTQVTAGGSHTCGIKTDGTLACWGSNISGEATP